MSRARWLAFVSVVSVFLSGCVSEAPEAVDAPLEAGPLRLQGLTGEAVIGPHSIQAWGNASQMVAMRFDLTEALVLEDLEMRLSGIKSNHENILLGWALFWRDDEPVPAFGGPFGFHNQFAHVAVLADEGVPGIDGSYPMDLDCQVRFDCSRSGWSIEFLQPVTLAPGAWWIIMATAHAVLDQFHVEFSTSSSLPLPRAIFIGAGCDIIDAREMGGTARIWGDLPGAFVGLHAEFESEDRLFLARLGYPHHSTDVRELDESLTLPDGQVLRRHLGPRNATMEDDLPREILNWNGTAGKVRYEMERGWGLWTGPPTLTYCTFSEDGMTEVAPAASR